MMHTVCHLRIDEIHKAISMSVKSEEFLGDMKIA